MHWRKLLQIVLFRLFVEVDLKTLGLNISKVTLKSILILYSCSQLDRFSDFNFSLCFQGREGSSRRSPAARKTRRWPTRRMSFWLCLMELGPVTPWMVASSSTARGYVTLSLTAILSFNRDRTAQVGFINIIYCFLQLLDPCLEADQSSSIRL